MMTTETRVGLFTFLALALLALSIFLLGDISIYRKYPLYVEFTDVGGLPDKALVKLSGVEAGKVKKIRIKGSKVIVELGIFRDVEIYRDSVFEVGSTNIIGSRFLRITQGNEYSGILKPGDYVLGTDTLSLDKTVNETMTSLKVLLEDLNKEGIFAKEVNETMTNLRELTAKLNDLVAALHEPLENSMHNADRLIAKLEELTDKLNSGEGAIGTLLTDKQVKEDVKETVTNLKEVTAEAREILTRVGGFKTYWVYEGLYEPTAKVTRSNFGLKISPREGRYYYLGASNIGNKQDIRESKDYVEKNQIDARIGWEGDFYDVYAGMLHGAGGIGLKLKPLYKLDYLKGLALIGEASDFQRNRVLYGRKFDRPKYMAGGEFKINRFFTVGARVDDIAETRHTQYGATITLEDKDIAYFLGIISLGTMRSSGEK
jgi:phospholipid/cholesterol/gamma-HCH transport system substrate-binding protein